MTKTLPIVVLRGREFLKRWTRTPMVWRSYERENHLFVIRYKDFMVTFHSYSPTEIRMFNTGSDKKYIDGVKQLVKEIEGSI